MGYLYDSGESSTADWRWQAFFWLGTLAFVIIMLCVLREVLLPFVTGVVFAYALNPLAHGLERAGLSRLGASALIMLAFLFFFLLLMILTLLIVPLLAEQIGQFAVELPRHLATLRSVLDRLSDSSLFQNLRLESDTSFKSVQDIMLNTSDWLGGLAASLWSGGMAFVHFTTLLLVSPVVTFYMLLDWDRMIARIDGWLPRNHASTIRRLIVDIDAMVAGFVRGQSMVCLLLGLFYAVSLFMVGLNFGIVIGLISGCLSFIPYVGCAVGLLLAGGMALFQFWQDWNMIALVLMIFTFGQFLEGNILYPKLVGPQVGLHPVWLIFALFSFGYLFGFVGLLLAVPLSAAMGVLSRFALELYLDSSLYSGSHVVNDE